MKKVFDSVADHLDRRASRSIDTSDCRAVCLMLGPYRNLTTLTASTLFLHPHCQVLNHAGARIFGESEFDFLSDYTPERLNRFIQYAIQISAKGKRGVHGGSITLSHAFDGEHAMKEAHERTGGQLRKESVRCLFWKESLRTANLIRQRGVELGRIFEREPRLRFLLPVRDPLDCALSNRKTGHVGIFEGLEPDATMPEVVDAILNEILWFAELQHEFPDRFFHYFEHSISRSMLGELARFCELEPTNSWLDAAELAMRTKKPYDHDPDLLVHYRRGVESRFAGLPAFADALLAFRP